MTVNKATTLDIQAGEKKLVRVPLSSITVSHNPRQPARELQKHLIGLGYYTGEEGEEVPWTPLELIHELVLNDEGLHQTEGQCEYVRIIEKYESDPKGIVDLACSRRSDEIQPVLLRSFRAKNPNREVGGYVERYGVVAGERRILAAAYNYAKHGDDADIGAQCRKLTVSAAYKLAVEENAQRKDPTAVEYGLMFRGLRDEINPSTGRGYTLKEISAEFGFRGSSGYQFVRQREALAYLSEAEQQRVENGTLGVDAASKKGILIRQGKDPKVELARKKVTRDRSLTLDQIRMVFDNCRSKSKGFLLGLAVCMQSDYEDAITESDERIEKQELKEAQRADKEALQNDEDAA